MHSGLLVFDS